MFFGLTIEKLMLIGVIAAVLVGPERLPRYAETLAKFTKRAKETMQGARSRMRDEMGPEFDDVDWKKLDPRQYDPRRIIREALLDDTPTATMRAAGAAALAAREKTTVPPFVAGERPPFDDEAT
ncbi:MULTISPECIES: Sec-independent protein translocase TatB [unclassified Microbacterium]|uniref:Sec-independent protein translocase TatB n=1 Tax=unclassified Microbacterium TaxID=2609290 RepID=UPI0008929B5F|nr:MULTISPECIES: Sec-independent protein translocase TatB [unclassified Microbacterium]AOX47007.1 Sec-independent protein translocase TatB [Microbacterium sp. BH-3-3-3]MBD8477916.1 Sec-independent protein translocase TatB [Microbacterium sp. CFBP 8794]